jgi:pimeloyl-ACP methyl ester carboxylesterase
MLHARDSGGGTGHPVVLVHSSGMSSRQWRTIGARLAPRFRVVAPDLLGYGDNPPWDADAPFSFHDDVGALGELILGFGQPVHLVGHSYGGLVAITHARLQPRSIRSLVLYDPVAMGVLHDAGEVAALAELPRGDGEGGFLDERIGGTEPWWTMFVDYWNGPGAWRGLPEAARAGFLRVGKKAFLEVRSLLADRTGRGAYRVIDAPALLLTGETSPLAARRVIALLGDALPRARSEVVAGGGHMGPLTHADVVAALIEAHLLAAD